MWGVLLWYVTHCCTENRAHVGMHVYYQASDNFEKKSKHASTDVYIHFLLHQAQYQATKTYLPIWPALHTTGCLKPEVRKSWVLCHPVE